MTFKEMFWKFGVAALFAATRRLAEENDRLQEQVDALIFPIHRVEAEDRHLEEQDDFEYNVDELFDIPEEESGEKEYEPQFVELRRNSARTLTLDARRKYEEEAKAKIEKERMEREIKANLERSSITISPSKQEEILAKTRKVLGA